MTIFSTHVPGKYLCRPTMRMTTTDGTNSQLAFPIHPTSALFAQHSEDYLDKVLKIKRKRFTELLEGVEKRDLLQREEEEFLARHKGADIDGLIAAESSETGYQAEIRKIKEGQQDPELALIDAMVLSEVVARSSRDVTALTR